MLRETQQALWRFAGRHGRHAMPVKEGARWELFDLIVKWYYRPRWMWQDLVLPLSILRERIRLYFDPDAVPTERTGKHRKLGRMRDERIFRYGF